MLDAVDGAGGGHSREYTSATYERVEGAVSCVLTRFRLQSAVSLPLFALHFRRIHKQARATVPGLLKAALLIEGPRTVYTLSLWKNDGALIDFGTRVDSHVSATRWVFARVFRRDLRRPEIWSVQFKLYGLSHNLNWDGLDLRTVLAQQIHVPPEDIAKGQFRKSEALHG
jgi:hypothetical protein